MIWIDYAILTVICASAILGLMRGFVCESFSLMSWIAALWTGLRFYPALAGQPVVLSFPPEMRPVAAFAGLFLATLIVGKVLGYLIGTLIEQSFLSGLNRMGGLLFGSARGLVLVLLLVLLAGKSDLPRQPWWRESRLLPPLEHWAGILAARHSRDYLQLVRTL